MAGESPRWWLIQRSEVEKFGLLLPIYRKIGDPTQTQSAKFERLIACKDRFDQLRSEECEGQQPAHLGGISALLTCYLREGSGGTIRQGHKVGVGSYDEINERCIRSRHGCAVRHHHTVFDTSSPDRHLLFQHEELVLFV